ncbi:putative microtubule-associated protein futsch-like [Scophthalmus maximus]|uniref:Putative microtubule-associated protein futsch-like n=1 Tax=Scophthalmus maximus TaxID=52904 RepID=A0A2U9BP12_SCOMX|nr:putative microtubule-associated protein futsch-like [Scophthalmus maximus]
MSGTTQPTEESRPGSAGPVAGSAWRAGGALLSELDSEDVSGSQQGASELSAPGVLEGTESMDDLGDGSLKGAIDMEGASAGSPDFEKVPDIPVNDFDEDDEDDDYDRNLLSHSRFRNTSPRSEEKLQQAYWQTPGKQTLRPQLRTQPKPG